MPSHKTWSGRRLCQRQRRLLGLLAQAGLLPGGSSGSGGGGNDLGAAVLIKPEPVDGTPATMPCTLPAAPAAEAEAAAAAAALGRGPHVLSDFMALLTEVPDVGVELDEEEQGKVGGWVVRWASRGWLGGWKPRCWCAVSAAGGLPGAPTAQWGVSRLPSGPNKVVWLLASMPAGPAGRCGDHLHHAQRQGGWERHEVVPHENAQGSVLAVLVAVTQWHHRKQESLAISSPALPPCSPCPALFKPRA